jgi:nicotinamide-nucleotide amidase
VRVAVVAVGDELLLGAVVNGNLAWTGRTLAAAGLDVVRGYEVDDDVDAIVDVLRDALRVADAVVVTGGLGPTSDDRTRDALAALAGVPLVEDPALLADLDRWFRDRRRVKPPTVDVQARRPRSARALTNAYGTAPGLGLEVDGRVVYAVPGVPLEMRAMLTDVVVPELRGRAGSPAPLLTRQLRVAVVGESLVAHRLQPLEADLPDGVRLAYLASPGEVRVRFTGTDDAALVAARDRARELLGAAVSGEDDETLAATVLAALGVRGETLAVAESLTGGQVVATLVDVPGASQALVAGVVAYATDRKTDLLGVPADLLDREGPVHPDVARAMARGVRDRARADWGLATTGVAGPDQQDGQDPGTVHVAVTSAAGDHVLSLRLVGDRSAVRTVATANALDLLRRAVLGLATDPEHPW